MNSTMGRVSFWQADDGSTARVRSGIATAAVSLLAAGMLAGLVRSFDVLIVLGGTLVAACGVLLVARPEIATLAMVCILYLNIPALAAKHHHVPQAVAASYLLLPLIPVAHHLVVNRRRMLAGPALWPMFVYLCAMLIAALGAVDRALAFERIQTFVVEGVVLYWLIVNAVRGVPSLGRVIAAILVAGSILGGLSFYQEVTGRFDQEFGGLAQRNNEFLELQQRVRMNPDDAELRALKQAFAGDGRSPRAHGPTNEPNYYAQILIVLVPLALLAYRTAATRTARLCAAAAGALIVSGILVSYSRGALVTLGLLVLLFTWLRWFRPTYVLIAGLCLVVVTPIVASDYLLGRVTSLTTVSDLSEGASSTSDVAMRGRATEMLAALQAWADHPLLGVGPGQYMKVYSVEYQQKDPKLKLKDIVSPRRAHSLYLEMAAETGLVGVSMFLTIVFMVMRELWSARRHWARSAPALSDLATALTLSLIGYLATGFFLSLSFERYFWLLVALSSVAVVALRDPAVLAPRTVERTRTLLRRGSFPHPRATGLEA